MVTRPLALMYLVIVVAARLAVAALVAVLLVELGVR